VPGGLIARGYHGTTLVAAKRIVSTKEFHQEVKPWHWLGQGVYFWQDAPLRAWDWAEQRVADDLKDGIRSEPAVISAIIDLGECLDLLDIGQWGFVEEAWLKVANDFEQSGEPIPPQIGPAEVFGRTAKTRYGNNQLDYKVMNLTVQLLKKRGAPVTTVRGAFMEGDDLFRGSWLLNRSHVQIAVVDPEAIPRVVLEPEMEDRAELKAQYEAVVRASKSSWTRMKPPC
jgi:hypothetical protein